MAGVVRVVRAPVVHVLAGGAVGGGGHPTLAVAAPETGPVGIERDFRRRAGRLSPRSRLVPCSAPTLWTASQASHRNSRHHEPSGFRSFDRYKSDPAMLSQIPDSNTCSLNLLLFVVSVTDVDC